MSMLFFGACFLLFGLIRLKVFINPNFFGRNEQALVCLSNREIVDASRGRTFHCKTANNRFFFNCFGLIYLAIYPPSIITANVRPPSASTDFFNFSETRACSPEKCEGARADKLQKIVEFSCRGILQSTTERGFLL